VFEVDAMYSVQFVETLSNIHATYLVMPLSKAGIPSVYCRILSQHPFSGAPCYWTFSSVTILPPFLPISVSGSKKLFFVNLSPISYCDIFVFAVYALVDSVIVDYLSHVKNCD